MKSFLKEYRNHAALNFGLAVQGLRYFHSHPDFDRIARRGSAKHLAFSCALRAKRVAVDLFFALVPPHTHHTKEQIASLRGAPFARWFQFGYCAWRFDEKGALKKLTGAEDRRWDPRCRK